MSAVEKSKFVYVTHIDATPEKVWEALTKPEFTEKYWGGRRIQSDWTVGASIKFIKPGGGIHLVGEVLECQPPRLLSCTFLSESPDALAGEKQTRLTFEIAVMFNVTKLTIIHDGFEPGSKLMLEVGHGWQAIACSLKTLVETGKPLPFTWPK